MQLNIFQPKISFDTHTLIYIQLDLIYAQEKHHAPSI